MLNPARFFLVAALLFALVGATPGLQQPVLAENNPADMLASQEYLNQPPAGATSPLSVSSITGARTINAPYFAVSNVTKEKFAEMAIFWFGKVTSSENYADVRVGYNDTALYVMASVIDRLTNYDVQHLPTRLTSYDGFSLYLNTGTKTTYPSTAAYRFDAQMNGYESRDGFQLAYRGTGKTWKRDDSIAFTSLAGYAGVNFNNGKDNNGWAITYVIPFSSLGLSSKPADLTEWGLQVTMHDRDKSSLRHRYWPEKSSGTRPRTWGRLVFGFPTYDPPAVTPSGSVTIRHKLNGASVPDAGVGGNVGNLCNANNMWTQWGVKNFAKTTSMIVQNQSNLHDWPCFAKYYVTFPLTQIPKGKTITSAKLVLYLIGGSDWSLAKPSLMQVMTVKNSWSATTLNWNNAPMAQENVAQIWVNPVDHPPEPDEWPGWRYEWDVTRAVADAALAGQPLRLVLYEADSEMHSGKQFNTSDVEDWNETGRPTLEVEWGQ